MLQRCTVVIVLGYAAAGLAHAQVPASVPTRDAMPASLTGAKGDPGRGRAIVANRQVGLCLLCPTRAFPEEPFQGDLAPDLKGAGARLSAGQIRARIVYPRPLTPAPTTPPP